MRSLQELTYTLFSLPSLPDLVYQDDINPRQHFKGKKFGGFKKHFNKKRHGKNLRRKHARA